MKLIIYKIAFLFLLIPLVSFSNNDHGKYKKTKKVSKSFEVNKNTTLNIKNKFGNVNIETWSENRIEIEVNITISGDDEENVETILDKTRILFKDSNNEVFATTLLSKKRSKSWFSSSWFSWSSSSSTNLQIDYIIRMPLENNLNITNDYGSISLNELNGKATINCDFGKLIIGKLNNIENEINFDYTKHSTFEFIENATIHADFSGFSIEKANTITLNANYTTSSIEQVKLLNYSCDFGGLQVDNVDVLNGKGDYASLRFDHINKTAQIRASFGSIKIDGLSESFKNIDINSNYTSIKIGFDHQVSCTIKADLSFGNLKYNGDLFTFNKIKEKSMNKQYEGYFNNENSNSAVLINSEFGSIKLYQK